MKILFINSTYGVGSTGKIVQYLANSCTKEGFDTYVCYAEGPSSNGNYFKFSSKFDTKVNSFISHIFGNYGFEAYSSTKRLVKRIKEIQPDVVHIHNIHSHDVKIDLLINCLKDIKCKVLFTMHDCWAYTGYCPYYTYISCNKWQTECNHCPLRKQFSFLFDRSKSNQERKRDNLNSIKPIIVSPSAWLKGETNKSFLQGSQTYVINNGVNQSIFQKNKSKLRDELGLNDYIVVLGVAYQFDSRKGIEDFLRLANDLPETHKLILIGSISKQYKIPNNVTHIEKTNDQSELADYYNMADIFINPTKEDNFPTTHIEAISCGCPVVSYDVGGACEVIDKYNGVHINANDYGSLLKTIVHWDSKSFDRNQIAQRAKIYSDEVFCKKYIDLYKEVFKQTTLFDLK